MKSSTASFGLLSLIELLQYVKTSQKPKSEMTLQDILEQYQPLVKISKAPTLKEVLDSSLTLNKFDIARITDTSDNNLNVFFNSHVKQYNKQQAILLEKESLAKLDRIEAKLNSVGSIYQSEYDDHVSLYMKRRLERFHRLGIKILVNGRLQISGSDYRAFDKLESFSCPVCNDVKSKYQTVCEKCHEILDIAQQVSTKKTNSSRFC